MRWRWPDLLGTLLSAGLLATPWWADFTAATAAALSAWSLGLALLVCFALASASPGMWKGWINLALALALMLAPFVLGFTTVRLAVWSHWIFGLAIGLAALWSLARTGADRPAEQEPATEGESEG
jgi:hypothetical protein